MSSFSAKFPGTPPELLLPAGGFEAGLAAFEGGADAVYLGFSSFSARKQAKNFDRLEYRRLLRLAHEQGKRIYVTINTIILESELEVLGELLAFLTLFPPDALIIQDLGLLELLGKHLPGTAIHASTQTAVQTPGAARLLRDRGVRRIVLPRECSPLDLARFKEEVPELEYEVFVHGALCYSFSGLCLASGLLLGRSGNRGDCAQVCRSYYSARGPGLEGEGYWFSCRDLCLFENLEELSRAGASSLKVEGRMKSPEYVYAVARLYRAGLDRLAGKELASEDLGERFDAARIAFSRSQTKAYLGHHAGKDILDAGFPGHRGLPIGRVVRCEAGASPRELKVLLELEGPLGLRDGLLALGRPRSGERVSAYHFPVLDLQDPNGKRSLVRAKEGSLVLATLGLSPECAGAFLPPDTPIARISAREQDRRVPSPEAYPPALLELPGSLSLIPEGGKVEAGQSMAGLDLELSLPEALRGAVPGPLIRLASPEPLPIARGKKPGGFRQALEVFAEGANAAFRLLPTLAEDGTIELPAEAALPLVDLFVPPSRLKRAKNSLYAQTTRLLEEGERSLATTISASEPDIARDGTRRERPASFTAPPRAALTFPLPQFPAGLPFATPRILRDGGALPEWGGWFWLPLSPLVAKTEDYETLVSERLGRELRNGRALMVGIGALHQVGLAARLRNRAEELGATERLCFFGDIHLYIANRFSLAAYARMIPGLRFAYYYLEASTAEELRLRQSLESKRTEAPALVSVGEGFEPPLFMSKACLLRHHRGKGSCPCPCPRHWITDFSDRRREYRVLVDDCISLLFRKRSRDFK